MVGENTLTATDDNTAGVTVTDGSTLTITGTGSLTVDDISIVTDSDSASAPLTISEDTTGDVTIVLSGDNTLDASESSGYAGLQKDSTSSTLTIVSETDEDGNETGSLTATGGDNAATVRI